MTDYFSFPEGRFTSMHRILLSLTIALFILLFPVSVVHVRAQDTLSTAELKQHSLEELMEMQVTSYSKRAERAFEVPAAIHVITAEDIRRSGATSIPRALRLASNLDVAQIDSRTWAISARGFNNSAANKLLVLIDGRSVYTPLYSGVFWDVQNVFIEDVDRIEVITGPAGSVWGSNAVNGVINIITKNAGDIGSKGALVTARGGTQEEIGGVRYAGSLSEELNYRAYFTTIRKDDTRFSNGDRAGDHWLLYQGGFKAGWDASENSQLAFQGDAYGGSYNQQLLDNTEASGGNLIGSWRHTLGVRSEYSVQAYYDLTHRMIPKTFSEDLGTADIDAQYRFPLDAVQDITLGAGYRYMNDRVGNTPALAFLPDDLILRLYRGFIQDEMTFLQERGTLTFGSKFEHNDFSGFEYQPSARISWLFTPVHMAWAAVSRALRTPSRIDRDFYVPGAPPYLLAGGGGFMAEECFAYEIGYRSQAVENLSVDIAGYYNVYNDLRSVEPGPPFRIKNGLEGTTYGAEINLKYQPTDWWTARAGYAYIQKEISVKPWSRDINNGQGEGNDPKHSLRLSSSLNLPGSTELDTWFRVIGELPVTGQQVPSYAEADLRFAWNPRNDLTLSVGGQNLLHDQHPEFGAPLGRHEIPRAFYAGFTWHQ
jgi:iron complex outermembrane receptor protein